MPRIGVDIITANGRGRVLNQELLTRQLLVQMEDGRRVLVHADEGLVSDQAEAFPSPGRSYNK